MKKLMEIAIPIKSFTAMIFSGFMVLYMISALIYSIAAGQIINYGIPFAFVLQSIGLSLIISVLWSIFFSNAIIKKWRFSLRLIVFKLSLLAVLGLFFFTFFNVSLEEARLWFIVALIIALFIILLTGICEMYFRKTGKDYTEILKTYKKNINI